MIPNLHGTCSEMEPADVDELFFEETSKYSGREAIAICSACPVQRDCYNWASDHRIPHGVFGGERGPDRRRRLDIKLYESMNSDAHEDAAA